MKNERSLPINPEPRSMMKRIGHVILILVIFSNMAYAQEAELTNIIVTNTRDNLLLYLDVKGAFTEKMESAIMSGVPATFSFFIALYRVRSFWTDEKITEITVTHTIKYDNLKKEFIVTRSGEAGKPTVTKSFDEAKKIMSKIESLNLVPLSELEKGMQYQVKAKAELSKLTLPLYLHYVLFFVSLWDFETDWYTLDFTY